MDDIGSDPKVILDSRIELGESIVWNDQEQMLYWVDIHAGNLWFWNGDSNTQAKTLHLPERVGALGLCEGGGVVLALASGFAKFDPQLRKLERLADVESDLPTTRLNDGRIDSAGRFVCGGMDEGTPQQPLSSLYSLGADGKVRRLLDGISCANSICWSPDGATMYFTDMPTRRIDAFDYAVATGELSNRRLFANLEGEPGYADGSLVDADGDLWNAQWGGYKIVRYRPDGTVEREVCLPVANPTCMTFGGPDLDILFVTSAWFGLSDEERARQPHAGSIFAFRPGVRGRKEYRYAR